MQSLAPRRAALRADEALTTVTQTGGEGCCSGRGVRRRLSKFQNLPWCEMTGLFSAASRMSSDFVVARARLVGAEADLRHFVGDAGRRSDLEPAAGEMVQHADLLDQLPRRVIGRHHAERAQPKASSSATQRWRSAGWAPANRRRRNGAR